MSSNNIYTSPLCSCIICRKEYSAKGIHTHHERAHGSQQDKAKYPSGHHGKYKDQTFLDKIRTPKCSRDIECEYCGKLFTIEIKITQALPRHCSKSCSAHTSNQLRARNGYHVSDETKNKISKSVNENNIGKIKTKFTLTCQYCSTSFITTDETKCHCGKTCFNKSKPRQKSCREYNLSDYRKACAFTFALSDFPNEFDFSLITEFGWYKAKNRGDNQYGISRDHRVSVRYGFDNRIDPKIISHPANCQLLCQNINASKGSKNSISVEELVSLIEKWNAKYN